MPCFNMIDVVYFSGRPYLLLLQPDMRSKPEAAVIMCDRMFMELEFQSGFRKKNVGFLLNAGLFFSQTC